MRWLRISLFALAGLAALLFTAIAVLFTVDFGRFKGRIETLVTDVLGRELRIEGELHANIGGRIEIYAENVFLANPEWADAEAFVSVDKIDISVNTWSLLHFPIIVERADINGVRVNIEISEEGASWQFKGLEKEPDVPKEPRTKRVRIPVVVDNVAIMDTVVSIGRDAWKLPLVIEADSLFADQRDGDNIQVILRGALNGTPLNFDKISGPISNLQELRDVDTVISGNIGEITIEGRSHIDDILAPSRPTLEIVIDGPNAQYLTDVLKIAPVTSGPLHFDASLQSQGDDLEAKVAGRFGEFSLDIDGLLQNLQNLNDIDITVEADGPDIGTIIRLAGRQYTDVDAFQINGRVRRSGGNLTIENVQITIGKSELTAEGFFDNFPQAKDARLSVVATGPDFGRFNRLFGMPGRLGGEFTTSLDIGPNGDGRTLIDLNARAPHADINIQSKLSSLERFVDSTVEFNIKGPDVGHVAEAAGWPGLPKEAWEISGFVEKDGSGYRVTNVRMLAGDDILRVDGHVGDDPIGGETDVQINFSGTDLGASVVSLGGNTQGLPKGSYELKGRINRQDQKLWLRDLDFVIGDNEEYRFNISGTIDSANDFIGSEVEVKARGASTAALVELAGISEFPDFPFEIEASFLRGERSTQISSGKLHVGTIDATFSGVVGDKPLEQDLSLTLGLTTPDLPLVIAEFGVPAELVPRGDLQLFARVIRENDRLTIDKLDISLDGTEVGIKGRVGGIPDLDGTSLDITIRGDDLAAAIPKQFSQETLRHPFSVSASVGLDGKTLTISDIQAELANTVLEGDTALAIDPFLGHGSFELESSSPDLYLLIPAMHTEESPPVAKMRFSGSGSWEDGFWTFDDLDLHLGDGRLQIDGSVDGPPDFGRTDLNIDWHSSSLRRLSRLARRPLPDQPLFMRAHVVGTDTVMSLEYFSLTSGHTDLSGNFTLKGGDVPEIDIDVTSNVVDIEPFQAESTDEQTTREEPPTEKKDKAIPDTPLPLDLLASLNAEINVDIAELRSRGLIVTGLELDGSLRSGELLVERGRFEGQRGGELLLKARLTPKPDVGAELHIEMTGSDLIMGLMADSQEELEELPLFTVNSELDGSGRTVRDVAGSLNGYFRLVGAEGKIKAGSFELFTQDFLSQLVNTINPFAKSDPYTNVECAAFLMKFTDGVVTGSPAFVQQTVKLRIFANADVNLKTEKLDVSFRTIPRKGLGISVTNLVNPYVKLGGTLTSPSLAIDPGGVLLEGGAALATAGLSILAKGLKDRFLSEKDPCGKAVTEADKSFGLSAQPAE